MLVKYAEFLAKKVAHTKYAESGDELTPDQWLKLLYSHMNDKYPGWGDGADLRDLYDLSAEKGPYSELLEQNNVHTNHRSTMGDVTSDLTRRLFPYYGESYSSKDLPIRNLTPIPPSHIQLPRDKVQQLYNILNKKYVGAGNKLNARIVELLKEYKGLDQYLDKVHLKDVSDSHGHFRDIAYKMYTRNLQDAVDQYKEDASDKLWGQMEKILKRRNIGLFTRKAKPMMAAYKRSLVRHHLKGDEGKPHLRWLGDDIDQIRLPKEYLQRLLQEKDMFAKPKAPVKPAVTPNIKVPIKDKNKVDKG